METYWHLGDELLRFLAVAGSAVHGEQTIRKLSKNLKLRIITLYDILRFRRQMSTLHARVNLGSPPTLSGVAGIAA